MPLKLDDRYLKGFISQQEYDAIAPQVQAAGELLAAAAHIGVLPLGHQTHFLIHMYHF